MIDGYTKCQRPLRDVDVEYSIDQTKCINCEDKPCISSCPIEAVFIDSEDGLIKIKSSCFGCVLCRNACPYDAIEMKVNLAPPIQENVPNINIKLCKSCGACVQACKIGAIHIKSDKKGHAYSEIDKDLCIRCGYCSRVCPTDAIKYGELIPKTVKGGKAIIVNQDKCIGCMTCTRVCPSAGSIEVGKANRLPYINPAYCARCEECMHSCPSTAIKYSSRKKAYATYSKIKSEDIVFEITSKDIKKLSTNIIRLDRVINKISKSLSLDFNDKTIGEDMSVNINGLLEEELSILLESGINVKDFTDFLENKLVNREINVLDKKCIACGECFAVCPTGAIKLDAQYPIKITDDCVKCGKCVETCKFDAIEIFEDYFYSLDDGIYYGRSYIDHVRDGELLVSPTHCQSCGICIKNCPTNTLGFLDDEVVLVNDECIYCRECESICPVDAIKIFIKE